MADIIKNYTKWISDFTKEQFDEVVEVYINKIWGFEEFVNTDGTNDGGNDIRIFQESKKLKVQIQVTVQESNIEGKVIKELENAVLNVTNYGYERKLYFFYSHPISEEKINEFETMALVKYQIELRLLDAKKIASATKYSTDITDVVHRQYGLELGHTQLLSEEDKMLYDFISFGSNTTQIKNQIIKAYLVHKLFEVEEIDSDTLINTCKEHFKASDSSPFVKLLNNLKSSLVKEFRKEGRLMYSLSDTETDRINVLKSQFSFQEQKLTGDIKTQLTKFGVSSDFTLKVIESLRELFEANFNIDKQEILDRAFVLEEEDKVTAFTNFFRKIRQLTASREKARLLAKNLLNLCKENDILQKLSAGKLFASFSDPDAIRNYINQVDRIVFCDTRIALYALCVYYEDVPYKDNYYESVKDFLALRSRYTGFHYKIFYRYINEIAFHLKEALLLIPFEEYNLLTGFGGTNNVFFNYYSFLKENQFLEGHINTFSDFLEEGFEVREGDAQKSNFLSVVEGTLRERLNSMGIGTYDHDASQEFLEDAKSVIKECQILRQKLRPDATINNDARMLAILFEEETSVNEPVFITWDQNLFCARKKFYQVYKGARLWHYFSPNQFVSHISILNFNIDSNAISREVLSIFDESFNLYEKTQHLLDTLSKLLNVRTETGRRYVQRIKEFKKEYIYEVENDKKSEALPEENNVPIEKILVSLAHHYSSKKDKYTIDDFKTLFTVEEIFEKVIAFFSREIEHYKRHQNKTEHAITDMNGLITEAISIKNDQKTPSA